ncbi:hypothetical protein [Nonomuraea sp. SBT364]|nr:hypothetical protein [Nonomuraea sp. SBT364]
MKRPATVLVAVLGEVPGAELRGFPRLLGRLAEVNREHARRLSDDPGAG